MRLPRIFRRALVGPVVLLALSVLATACPAPLLGPDAQREVVWTQINAPIGTDFSSPTSTFVGWWRQQAAGVHGWSGNRLWWSWQNTRSIPEKRVAFTLDFSTDWCGPFGVATTGPTWDFHAACLRHDFAYRNLKLLDRRWSCLDGPRDQLGRCLNESGRFGRNWNEGNRRRVDDRFRQDMMRH